MIRPTLRAVALFGAGVPGGSGGVRNQVGLSNRGLGTSPAQSVTTPSMTPAIRASSG